MSSTKPSLSYSDTPPLSSRQADKKEAEKQVQLEKLMKDMQGPSGSSRGVGTEPGANPFGPHGRNDREDA
jgi:hypothetical protein